MSIAIKTENLSKLYRLGVVSSKTISQDFNRFLARVSGKEDPYQKIGAVNNRLSNSGDSFVWALKDINIEINKGDIIGIIGKNGAGKSTLLKILSRVTSPTEGIVRVKGRIASLLEVGTGFHQELTGRENVYLNGSILGMTQNEIRKKFDEIVEFSGVGNYIDTPVKRYSSGMFVRLAFAVAAHLEPEILIVDEVLAVGDAEFQKRCLGKMQEVSQNDGRTVLFVSHNMGAISNLCTTSILLENGMMKCSGKTEEVIPVYLNSGIQHSSLAEFSKEKPDAFFREVRIVSGKNDKSSGEIDVRFPFTLNFRYQITNFVSGMSIAFSVYSGNGTKIFYSSARIEDLLEPDETRNGMHQHSVEIPGMFLAPGEYFVNISLQIENIQLFDLKENALRFTIVESGTNLHKFKGKDIGVVLTDFKWKTYPEEK